MARQLVLLFIIDQCVQTVKRLVLINDCCLLLIDLDVEIARRSLSSSAICPSRQREFHTASNVFLPVNSPGVQQMIRSEMNRREVRMAEKIRSISTVWRWLRRLLESSSEQPNHERRKWVSSLIRWTTSAICVLSLPKGIHTGNIDRGEETWINNDALSE